LYGQLQLKYHGMNQNFAEESMLVLRATVEAKAVATYLLAGPLPKGL
jgi:hypothetical protein